MRRKTRRDFTSNAEYDAYRKAQREATQKRTRLVTTMREKKQNMYTAQHTAQEIVQAAKAEWVQSIIDAYGQDMTLHEIAAALGMSKSRVHQLVQAAVQAAPAEEQTA